MCFGPFGLTTGGVRQRMSRIFTYSSSNYDHHILEQLISYTTHIFGWSLSCEVFTHTDTMRSGNLTVDYRKCGPLTVLNISVPGKLRPKHQNTRPHFRQSEMQIGCSTALFPSSSLLLNKLFNNPLIFRRHYI
jgi:hypothetical protein